MPKTPKHRSHHTHQSGHHHFSSLTTVFIIVLLIVLAGLAGFAAGGQMISTASTTNTTTADEPLEYPINDELYTVSAKAVLVKDVLNPTYWKDASTNSSASFRALLAKYEENAVGIRYDFTYTGVSQDKGIWTVTVIPNKLGYTSTDQFLKDFPPAGVGDDLYANTATPNYLQFVSSCGTGFDDGSGRPIGCDVVQDAVLPTLKLQ